MFRIKKKCQNLSSWIGRTISGISKVTPNYRELKLSQETCFRLIDGSKHVPNFMYRDHVFNQINFFSTMAGTILVQARDPAKLNFDILNAVDEHRYEDAWRFFDQHLEMEGFPRKSVVNKLLVSYAETSDSKLLERAFGLVERAFEEGKQTLFEKETLMYLALALARCSRPVPASIILRKLIRMEEYPPVTAWSAILAYMSLSSSGAYLSAELILETGYLFLDNRIDPRKKSNAPLIAMKPNTIAIGVALAGCLMSGTTRIAEQLLDIMPRIGVKIDANLLVLMAQIYEKNGRKEELKKLKRHFDEAHNLNDVQLRQYYNCLLSCHLKFGDLDSASQMVLEMLRKAKEASNSLAAATLKFEPAKEGNLSHSPKVSDAMELGTEDKGGYQLGSLISFDDFCRDRNFISLEGEAKKILMYLSMNLQKQVELIMTERGILQATEKAYVKLAKAFLEAGKTKELAEFLIKVEKEDSPSSVEDSALIDVINSCISLGLLDRAHDLLDEMRFAGIKASTSVYSSLLKAYCKEKRMNEVTSLWREVRRAGIQLEASCYEALIQSKVLQKDTQGALHLFKEMKEAKLPRVGHRGFEVLAGSSAKSSEAGFMAKLLEEIKEGEVVDCGVHDWNNVIHFFCKKRLMQDAEKALKKMRSLGHTPNAQTFHSMVTGYAAIGGKYIEVAELWGELKSLAAATSMKFDQELLDSLLYTFVRGGFFVRANEVVEMMEKGKMFVDKYRYRTLFLKYHKTLYKGKTPKYQTEAQSKKREAALAFKKWVGLF
ncbi:pentatricopeptide repeat-containing protein At1g03100, mitochondrial isoform X1 [Amaranthus tricolor]|uniref:pentatricopeptide repeat-containing protein At1g03100, mitochondrial isoform X1 n=2 Tax=Amaranthus tricolor TaxID=29722 RepID=UPI0025859CFC|nr:pentatricopeptide repeat-containing protein At1g03100, mitochondrial isoform X1 [Amaranthus tricolor]XP_057519664.1 pentatricopeptide repeat-containing protein At1g03100, mitochondrial isoform X1 [Amaranthus tricolor]XP_057519665.1 pentatricopeptide repeat-containing protein At1g03100, mitochondrial isoform X1 [Amaranthus tricolor]XP_057519666.1 pentatricopeptide repeat-containing protein At1g03100, mitochondrial isoform X1 [Amaranthus tricolor]